MTSGHGPGSDRRTLSERPHEPVHVLHGFERPHGEQELAGDADPPQQCRRGLDVGVGQVVGAARDDGQHRASLDAERNEVGRHQPGRHDERRRPAAARCMAASCQRLPAPCAWPRVPTPGHVVHRDDQRVGIPRRTGGAAKDRVHCVVARGRPGQAVVPRARQERTREPRGDDRPAEAGQGVGGARRERRPAAAGQQRDAPCRRPPRAEREAGEEPAA